MNLYFCEGTWVVIFFMFFNIILGLCTWSPLLCLDLLAANKCLHSMLYFLESLLKMLSLLSLHSC